MNSPLSLYVYNIRIRAHALQVNRIVEYIMQCVFKSDFASLQSFWVYLYRRFFSQMNSESLSMAYKLETNVLRCGRSGVVSPPSFLLSLFLSLSLCLSLSLSLSLSLTAGCSWCRPAGRADKMRFGRSLRRCRTLCTTAKSGKTGLVGGDRALVCSYSVT